MSRLRVQRKPDKRATRPAHIKKKETKIKQKIWVNNAVKRNELLAVNAERREGDLLRQTRFFKAKDRESYAVQIENGQFVKKGQVFDTKKMESHFKQKHASFTLNTKGQVHAFDHFFG